MMLLLAIALAASLARAEPQLPAGVTCADVRARVAEYGYARAIYWARQNGYSWSQIAEAKKCLR